MKENHYDISEYVLWLLSGLNLIVIHLLWPLAAYLSLQMLLHLAQTIKV